MAEWSFLTNHARVLVCIARDPGVRLREIADVLGVTERRAFGIVDDLAQAGYVVKERDGRRNRYRIQHHLPLQVHVGR
jgi:DNA-binding MarR family transcriptional regulator